MKFNQNRTIFEGPGAAVLIQMAETYGAPQQLVWKCI